MLFLLTTAIVLLLAPIDLIIAQTNNTGCYSFFVLLGTNTIQIRQIVVHEDSRRLAVSKILPTTILHVFS